MEFRTLQYFLAVAREENMTAAARILHISQPALSYQIKELEEELQTQLFIRSGRRLILSEDGMFLKSRAEEILSLCEKTKEDLVSGNSDIYGDIYIGAAESRGMETVAKVVAAVRREHPNIRFHFHSGNLDDVYERLSRGTLDFAVLLEPVSYSNFESIILPGADRMGIVIRRDHPLAAKKEVCAQDLYDLPLFLNSRTNMSEKVFADMMHMPPERLNVAGTGNLPQNLAVMAGQGAGGFVSLEGLVSTGPDSQLVFLPFSPVIERRLLFVWKQSRPFSKAAALFLERVSAAVTGQT